MSAEPLVPDASGASGAPGSPVVHEDDHGLRPKVFWPLFAVGAAVMVYGVHVLLDTSRLTHPVKFGEWFAGALVLHDFVLVPAVLLVGAGVHRLLRGVTRSVVQAGLFVSGLLVLLNVPLHEAARNPTNPTILPRPYGTTLALALLVVWLVVAAVLLVLHRRRVQPIAADEQG